LYLWTGRCRLRLLRGGSVGCQKEYEKPTGYDHGAHARPVLFHSCSFVKPKIPVSFVLCVAKLLLGTLPAVENLYQKKMGRSRLFLWFLVHDGFGFRSRGPI